MEQKRLRAHSIIRAYNRKRGTSVRNSDRRTDLIEQAFNCNPHNYYDYTMSNEINAGTYADFDSNVMAYIRNHHGDLTPAPATETPQPVPTPAPAPATGYDINRSLDLLQQALVELLVKTKGDEIKNAVIGDFKQSVDKYIAETYGAIERKISLNINDKRVEFNEVLHEKFETILNFVANDEPVYLAGKAGTGKNVICKQVAKALGLDFYFSNAITQEYKLTGFTDANGNYHETQFYKAFKYGGLFMLDEIDASIPDALIILNCAIANRYFDFPHGKDSNGNEVGGYTEAHPNFRVISAGNTYGLGADYDYTGRNQLDMASLDRFAMVKVDYDVNIELALANNDMELVNFCRKLRARAEQSGIRLLVSYRTIKRIATMESRLGLAETLTTCLYKGMNKDDIITLISGLEDSSRFTAGTKKLVNL